MDTFEQGATVYLLDGRECEYVAAASDRHIVRPVYDTDQGPWLGDDEIVSGVFSKPPTERLEAAVRELEARLGELRAEQLNATRELSQAEQDVSQRIGRLRKFKALERIEDFIEGRITHFVVTSQYGLAVSVETAEEALKSPDRNISNSKRLLCLFGDTKGDFTWRVNRWSDGSGSWEDKEPFCSEDEALERARGLCRDRIAEAEANTHTGGWDGLIKSCWKLGVKVSKTMIERHVAAQTAAAQKMVDDAKKRLADSEAHLAEISA